MNPETVERAISISSISSSQHHIPIPDGGWGWVIVFGSFMISLLTDGFSYTSGVFYEKFLKEYKESEAVTSIFVSVMTGMISCMGPVASGLSQTYGCRLVTISGVLITVLGMVISTIIDHNMYCHAVTLGGLVGESVSSNTSVYIYIHQYVCFHLMNTKHYSVIYYYTFH